VVPIQGTMKSAAYREQLRELHVDLRNAGVRGLVATYAPLAAALVIAMRWPGFLSGAVAFAVIGCMQYRLFMSCHEAVHQRLLFPRGRNEAFGVFHAALVGVCFERYRRHHLAHHRAARVADDPDAAAYRPVLEAPPGPRRLLALLAGQLQDWVQHARQLAPGPADDTRERLAVQQIGVVAATQVGLLVVLTLALGPWAYFVLWLAPLATIATFLNRARLLVEHGYRLAQDGHAREQLGDAPLEAIDLVSHPLECYLVAPFEFNHHSAHHRFPGVPFYRLPDLVAVIARHEPDYDGPVSGCYGALLLELLWGRPRTRPEARA
jgi:fatty acid desaturase